MFNLKEYTMKMKSIFNKYLQPIVTQYLVCNKSEIWP